MGHPEVLKVQFQETFTGESRAVIYESITVPAQPLLDLDGEDLVKTTGPELLKEIYEERCVDEGLDSENLDEQLVSLGSLVH